MFIFNGLGVHAYEHVPSFNCQVDFNAHHDQTDQLHHNSVMSTYYTLNNNDSRIGVVSLGAILLFSALLIIDFADIYSKKYDLLYPLPPKGEESEQYEYHSPAAGGGYSMVNNVEQHAATTEKREKQENEISLIHNHICACRLGF